MQQFLRSFTLILICSFCKDVDSASAIVPVRDSVQGCGAYNYGGFGDSKCQPILGVYVGGYRGNGFGRGYRRQVWLGKPSGFRGSGGIRQRFGDTRGKSVVGGRGHFGNHVGGISGHNKGGGHGSPGRGGGHGGGGHSGGAHGGGGHGGGGRGGGGHG